MPDAVISTDGLTRRFGQRRGITYVTLAVAREEVFGFLGPNGAKRAQASAEKFSSRRPSAAQPVA